MARGPAEDTLARALRWSFLGAAAVCALLILLLATDVRMSMAAWVVSFGYMAVVAAGFVAMVALAIVNRPSRIWIRACAIYGVLLLGAGLIALSGLPYDVRWRFEKPAFADVAEKVLDGAPAREYADTTIGGRRIDAVTRSGDGAIVYFRFAGTTPLRCDRSGVLYARPPVDPREADVYASASFTELGDGWWRYQICGPDEL